MTVEELMKQRYKVIADFPGSKWEVGAILTAVDGIERPFMADYPRIFQRLSWYEDRTLEEMPACVRHTQTGELFFPEWYPNAPYLFDDPHDPAYQWTAREFVPWESSNASASNLTD